jgi:hypothetical protein
MMVTEILSLASQVSGECFFVGRGKTFFLQYLSYDVNIQIDYHIQFDVFWIGP